MFAGIPVCNDFFYVMYLGVSLFIKKISAF